MVKSYFNVLYLSFKNNAIKARWLEITTNSKQLRIINKDYFMNNISDPKRLIAFDKNKYLSPNQPMRSMGSDGPTGRRLD
jgi:hypothetical protein